MHKLNTHHYDGMLNVRFMELNNYLSSNNIEIITLDKCYEEILELLNRSLMDIRAKNVCINILHELISDSVSNYDPLNNIHVHKLLPLVWSLVKHKYDMTGKLLFLEQINDISKGMCAQGRTTRILQIAEF